MRKKAAKPPVTKAQADRTIITLILACVLVILGMSAHRTPDTDGCRPAASHRCDRTETPTP